MDERHEIVFRLDLRVEHWHDDEPHQMHRVEFVRGEVVVNEPNWAREDHQCECGERVSVMVTTQRPSGLLD